VWTNLLDNAAGALSGGGQVTLRTSRDGDDVVVEVRDDGPGIPPEVLPRVFDTFFTTKPAGLGSGLGLDNVKRIVERRHGGTVEIDSSTGPGPTGTAVRVRLPVVGRT
jgi:signal transduction histidine kinase